MKAAFGHIQFNIDYQNIEFYKDLLLFLGWKVIHQSENMMGFGYPDGTSLWFTPKTLDIINNYDGPGVNHIAFHTEGIEDVDKTVDFLRSNNMPALFETPRHRPEFSEGADHTYYQVMFESPDKILFEVVYLGFKGDH